MKNIIFDILSFILIIICVILLTQEIHAQSTERIRGNLTIDKEFTYGLAKTPVANLAGRTTIAWSDTSIFKDSLSTDTDPAYTFTDTDEWEYITLYLYSDGTNGITFPSGIIWQGTTSVAPTSLQANSYNIFKFWKPGWMVFGISVGGFKYP